MCDRRQSLMEKAATRQKKGDGDAMSCSTDTSRWSTTPRLHHGSNTSHYFSDGETDRRSEANSSDKGQGPKPPGGQKGKKAQFKKTKYGASHQNPELPPIKTPQVFKLRIQSANLSSIRELQSHVWDLQQQLTEATTENKLLKRLQHRHMMALQHFQDSEGSLSQILSKHDSEVRVLQGLLRETRSCRDSLARQLQATENKLLSTKASLQHLQALSQDHCLLQREELTLRLNKATAEIKEKDKRVQDLERNLELCQASFKRQIVTEQRKTKEARKMSFYLREQVHRLNRDIQDRERELETHNIYSHRFLKGFTKKGRESKMVQTDGEVPLPAETVSLLEFEYTKTEEWLEEKQSSNDGCCSNSMQETLATENPETEPSASVTLQENHHEDTGTHDDSSEQSGCSEKSPEQTEGDYSEETEDSEAPEVLEEEQRTEEYESEVTHVWENVFNTTRPKRKGYNLHKVRRNYTFKQSIENLHNGRPAYSSADVTPHESTKSPVREICLPDGKCRRDGVDSTHCE